MSEVPARRRSAIRLAAAAVALAAVAGTVTVAAGREAGPKLDLSAFGPAAAGAADRTPVGWLEDSVVAVPPTTLPPLPVPQDVPADPYADEPEIRLGRLEIPAIGLQHELYQGVTLTSIDRGPSHWPGTALPGALGNAVIAGHRVTNSHPFRDIDQLQPGDQAIFTTAEGRFVYEMVGHEVVTPDGMHIVDQAYDHTATLFACHPPGSARYRYVVKLRLLPT